MNIFSSGNHFYFVLLLTLFFSSNEIHAQQLAADGSSTSQKPLDSLWQEHWFEHKKQLKLVGSNDDVAVYYDDQMPNSVRWPIGVMGKCWAYVKQNYGAFGADPKLYVILHQVNGKDYGGGHPSPFFDRSHDYKNVIDCGLGNWTNPVGEQIGMPIHEMGHIVTSASHGAKGSPSDALWGDSKFMEIFNYDVLLNIGMKAEAERVFTQMQSQYDDFPRARTQWFKNWFYPIYSGYGKGKVLNKYFALLAQYFPKGRGNRFQRDLNYGEFVHFWSGAAGVDLKKTAEKAFGWPMEYELQLQQAKKEFSGVIY
ncbi:hypothetical protein OQZ33_21115 [Pedobacter sp. MC2016-05]|uniref:hypothetical protein n=1 Tax=Pedobacter sp. MC2016-05 TaxID=2994474 RepID=UPI0022458B40|nr:hypothetical protein [Pedobacter sp. MC2016-05]MCX2476847.1 hypothetical protein [Pedobacter sp. MC2016-05]